MESLFVTPNRWCFDAPKFHHYPLHRLCGKRMPIYTFRRFEPTYRPRAEPSSKFPPTPFLPSPPNPFYFYLHQTKESERVLCEMRSWNASKPHSWIKGCRKGATTGVESQIKMRAQRQSFTRFFMLAKIFQEISGKLLYFNNIKFLKKCITVHTLQNKVSIFSGNLHPKLKGFKFQVRF